MAVRSHWGEEEEEREEGSDSDRNIKDISSHTNRKKHFNFCLSAALQGFTVPSSLHGDGSQLRW